MSEPVEPMKGCDPLPIGRATGENGTGKAVRLDAAATKSAKIQLLAQSRIAEGQPPRSDCKPCDFHRHQIRRRGERTPAPRRRIDGIGLVRMRGIEMRKTHEDLPAAEACLSNSLLSAECVNDLIRLMRN